MIPVRSKYLFIGQYIKNTLCTVYFGGKKDVAVGAACRSVEMKNP